jgi:ATP-dependent Clp protease protease subunit
MPIGIPKVPYTRDQNKTREYRYKRQWIDLFTKISQDRVLFLTQKLEPKITNQIISILLALNLENKEKAIALYVNCNSPNSSLKCGLSIVDTVSYVQNVNTINFGNAASIVSLVRASGKKGKRLALPHSRFRPYLSVNKSSGQALTISQDVYEKDQLLNRIRQIYIKIGCRFDKFLPKTSIPLNTKEFYQKESHIDSFQTSKHSPELYDVIKKCTINYLNNIKIMDAHHAIIVGLVDKIGKI